MLDPIRQSAAIPLHEGRVFLITSRTTGRWVIPKGLIDPGHTPTQAAIIEAWEEAGLIGTIEGTSLGSYHYEKYDLNHHVLVFRMTVTEVKDAWPEKATRERIWVTLEEAIGLVDEPVLKEILRKLKAAE